MRKHLRNAPVHVAEIADAESHWRGLSVAHLASGERYFECQVNSAMLAIFVARKIRQWRRVTLWTSECFRTIGHERFHGDDPWRDGRSETLGEEWSERLGPPSFNVAREPIVNETEAEDVLLGLVDRNALAEFVSGADIETGLGFIVETLAGSELRKLRGIIARLSLWTANFASAGNDARSATVIADGHVLVIRQQRIVGAEHASDIRRVIDRRIEIRVVADVCRHQHFSERNGTQVSR